jgi:uncharacterized protein YlxW (UPF0749 family)
MSSRNETTNGDTAMIATASFAETLLNEERTSRETDRISHDADVKQLCGEVAVLRRRVEELTAKAESLENELPSICREIGDWMVDQLTISCVGGEYEFSSAPVATVDVTGDPLIVTTFKHTAHLGDDTVELEFILDRVAMVKGKMMATYGVEFA